MPTLSEGSLKTRGDLAHSKVVNAITNNSSQRDEVSCVKSATNVGVAIFGADQFGGCAMKSPFIDFGNQGAVIRTVQADLEAGKFVYIGMRPDHHFCVCPAGGNTVRVYMSYQLPRGNGRTEAQRAMYSMGTYLQTVFGGINRGVRSIESLIIDLKALTAGTSHDVRTAAADLFCHQACNAGAIQAITSSAGDGNWSITAYGTRDL